MKGLETLTNSLIQMLAEVGTFGADAQRRFVQKLEGVQQALERLSRELRDINMAYYRECEFHEAGLSSEEIKDVEYTDDSESRTALRAAMRGRKVFIDDYPYTHKGALNVLRDESGYVLMLEASDATTLKLKVRFAE